MLVIDDLVDTGKTARLVRDMVPKCHYATMYAKPAGRPLVDTFITEVSQDTWIYFPWDMGYSLPAAHRRRKLAAEPSAQSRCANCSIDSKFVADLIVFFQVKELYRQRSRRS